MRRAATDARAISKVMAKKSKARIARDREAATLDRLPRAEPATIIVSEEDAYAQLSKLRPTLTYPELRDWVEGMSEHERQKTLSACARAVVDARSR